MPKTVKIVLGDAHYEVPRLNVGQIEDIMELAKNGERRVFDELRIAMRRCAPPCEDLSSIEASPQELAKAIQSICAISGVVLEPKGKAKV